MRVLTPLLGYLGKSGAKANTPEEGDTKILVPGLLQPGLEIPFPIFSLYNAPLPAGNIPVNSFMFSEEVLFNVNSGVVLFPLGPGVWDFDITVDLRGAGAVQDATSTYRIELLDTTTAISVVLARLANDSTKTQNISQRWRQMITSDQGYSVTRTSVVGAGTGTNFAHCIFKATRLF
jgi:hypothetical protein